MLVLALLRPAQMRIMHDVHLRQQNLQEYLRMDRGGLIMVWPPQDKPRNMAGPPPNFGGKEGGGMPLD